MGGGIEEVVFLENATDIVALVSERVKHLKSWMVVGGGSNILASDDVYVGTVVVPRNQKITFKKNNDVVLVTAGAGVEWDTLVQHTTDESLWGLENLSGIPGTVGAAPIQNIGAYGVEVSETVESVRVYDTQQKNTKVLHNSELGFGYRTSMLKKNYPRFVVLEATFCLRTQSVPNTTYKDLKLFFGESTPTLQEIREAVITIRKGKFPNLDEYGTAGSFFMNPIITHTHLETLLQTYPTLPHFKTVGGFKISLAWVLDQVIHAKTMSVGGALVWDKQPLVIATKKNAHAGDVRVLQQQLQEKVFNKTNIKIFPEVLIL